MFVKLPKSHPPINGCLNLFSPREMMDVDFGNWDFDDNGLSATVIIKISKEQADFEFASKFDDNLYSSLLPLRIQEWVNENIDGLWLYDVKNKLGVPTPYYKFTFQIIEEAVLFKLRWNDG